MCGRFANPKRVKITLRFSRKMLNAISLRSRTHWQIQRRAGNQSSSLSERDEHLHLDPVFWGYAPGGGINRR